MGGLDDVEEVGWAFHPDRDKWTGWGADAQQWIRRQFDPHQARVWRDSGVPPEEATGWLDTGWDAEIAIEWVTVWRDRFGDTKRCLTDANTWVDVGVSPRVAADLITQDVNPETAEQRFCEYGLSTDSRWRRVAGDPMVLQQWRATGLDPTDAEMWEDCGFGPDEADRWMDHGFMSSFEAQHFQAMGYTNPAAAQEARSAMIDHDPPVDDRMTGDW